MPIQRNPLGHFSSNNTDVIPTVAQYLKDPTLIRDALNDLSADQFITESLFTGGYNAPGGAVKYSEGAASKYVMEMDDPDEDFSIAEGTEFHQVYQEEPAEVVQKVKKYGIEGWLTYEDESRNQIGALARLTTRMMNSMVKYFDTTTLNKLATDTNIREFNRTANWYTRTTDSIIDDVFNAVDMIEDEPSAGGTYTPDAIVMSNKTYGMLRRNKPLQDLFGERPDNPVFTGEVEDLAGVPILKSPYMRNDMVFVLQRGQIGGIADEVPLTMKPVERVEAVERIYVRAKRLTVAFLTDPGAIVRIENINA